MVSRTKSNKERRAKAARRSSRSLCPRPPLRGFTKECGSLNCKNRNPLRTSRSPGGRCRFSGASPVASALGIRCGRDPAADTINPNTAPRGRSSKEDISTLRTSGHFYFALTGGFPAGKPAGWGRPARPGAPARSPGVRRRRSGPAGPVDDVVLQPQGPPKPRCLGSNLFRHGAIA